MLKKIILGIAIAAVLSLTAFGAVYAYQKENTKRYSIVDERGLPGSYGPGSGQDCSGFGAEDCQDCLQAEERTRSNFRYRTGGECTSSENRQEIRQQCRYEYENHYSDQRSPECGEEGGYSSRNGNNGNGRGAK